MTDINFKYIASSNEEAESFKTMRKKHSREASEYDDNFYLTQIFNYLADTYNNFTTACRNSLKQKKEEDITDNIRRKLQKNKDFSCGGFIVNTEARNQSEVVGYYDLKFEHSDWKNQYFAIECKKVNTTKGKIDDYLYKKATTSDEEDGGLYRFLINKYAENLPFGGMLGYITSHKPNDVVTKLKEQIKLFQLPVADSCFGNLIDSKLLEIPVDKFPYSFQSNHTRVNSNKQIIAPIHIFHLFFDFTE
jgi:hypothetical protein